MRWFFKEEWGLSSSYLIYNIFYKKVLEKTLNTIFHGLIKEKGPGEDPFLFEKSLS